MDLRYITLISAILFLALNSHLLSTNRFWLFSAINLLATLMHELSHYLVALVLNAKPVRFSIFPQRSADVWVMGYVQCTNLSWYNAAPVALAPLTLFIPVVMVTPSNIFCAIFLGLVAANAVPSRADLAVVFNYPISILFYTLTLFVIFLG